MADIYFALLLQALVCGVLYVFAKRVARRYSKRVGLLLGVAACVVGVVYVLFFRESVFIAKMLPFSNLIVLANGIPPASAFLAGIAWRLTPGHAFRRAWPVVALGVVGTFAAVQPILGHPPPCADQWEDDGVCRQTSPKSCTAACAASVLRMHGISATEEEMAGLCLTRKGTTWYGLYRGLKIKTQGTPYDVEVFACTSDQLRQRTPDVLILSVGLPTGANVPPIYTEQWGWRPGVLHTVLLFDFVENDRVAMGDPDVGREQWTVEDLRILWCGRGMRLVPR